MELDAGCRNGEAPMVLGLGHHAHTGVLNKSCLFPGQGTKGRDNTSFTLFQRHQSKSSMLCHLLAEHSQMRIKV